MATFQNTFNQLAQFVKTYIHRAERKAIAKSALTAVVQRHPDWIDAGFDEHFLTHSGVTLMNAYYQMGQLPTPVALIEAWSSQFVWREETKQKAQERFLPIAQDFIYVLSSELRQPETILVQQPQAVALS